MMTKLQRVRHRPVLAAAMRADAFDKQPGLRVVGEVAPSP